MLSCEVMAKYGDGIYEDTGCPFYPKCLECPFPDCLEDKIPLILAANRRVAARGLAEQGLTIAGIAEKLGVSRMQVYRDLGGGVT